ncbi:hypothetical protein GQR58_029728 [Nymphon striatum]|nr:hypothetical protein GQR58_029728 [Nymphon striatum]
MATSSSSACRARNASTSSPGSDSSSSVSRRSRPDFFGVELVERLAQRGRDHGRVGPSPPGHRLIRSQARAGSEPDFAFVWAQREEDRAVRIAGLLLGDRVERRPRWP